LIIATITAITADVVLTYWALSTGNFVEVNQLGFYPHTIIIPYLAYIAGWYAVKLLEAADHLHFIIMLILIFPLLTRIRVILLNIFEVIIL